MEAKPHMIPRDLHIVLEAPALIETQIYNPFSGW